MNNVEQFFQNSHYNIIRIFLSGSGLWPFHTIRRRYPVYLVMILILGSGFTFQILGLMDVWQDSFELIDSLPLLLLAVVTKVKVIHAIYALPKIKWLLIKMREYCLSQKSDKETKIQNSHALYGRNLCYAYTGMVLSHVVIFISSTLLSRLLRSESDKNNTLLNKNPQIGVSYRVNYMVDFDTYYAPIFLHTATCSVSYMLLIITFDILYITLVEHCCGSFEALRYRLETVFVHENDGDDSTTTTMKDKSYSNVAYSIRRHAEVMQFVAVMDSVYSIPLFVHVGCTMLVLSVLGYQVITNTTQINHLLKHTSYLNGLMINIFFENWLGQKIIDTSEEVFNSAYNSEWYNMPIAARKLLVMVIMKSKTPLILTASKIIVLSYVTFNAVMRTSMSYFMLIRNFA